MHYNQEIQKLTNGTEASKAEAKKPYKNLGITTLEFYQEYKKVVEGDESVYMQGNEVKEYMLPKLERFHYHVEIEAVLHDQITGEKISRPRIVKYYPHDFDKFLQQQKFQGYVVDILHNPNKEKEYIEILEKQERLKNLRNHHSKTHKNKHLQNKKKRLQDAVKRIDDEIGTNKSRPKNSSD